MSFLKFHCIKECYLLFFWQFYVVNFVSSRNLSNIYFSFLLNSLIFSPIYALFFSSFWPQIWFVYPICAMKCFLRPIIDNKTIADEKYQKKDFSFQQIWLAFFIFRKSAKYCSIDAIKSSIDVACVPYVCIRGRMHKLCG